jgi:ABC-type nitrate/sulfonate/bicarbonate transport system permease component
MLRRVNLLGLGTVLVALALWQVADSAGLIRVETIPSPVAIAQAGWETLLSGELVTGVVHTIRMALLGWAIAAVGGTVLGLALGLSHTVWTWSMATFEFLRSIPGIVFVPLAVIFYGLSDQTELFIVTYVAIWPVLTNTMLGVEEVPVARRDVARVLGLSRLRQVSAVVIPSSAAHILVALRLALGTSFALAVVAEMLVNRAGLGYGLILAQQSIRPAQVYAYVVTIGIVGLILNSLLLLGFRLVAPGIVRGLKEQADG